VAGVNGDAARGGTAIDVAIAGKTGSGKTTVAALVALAFAAEGRKVVAVDTDDPPNLGLTFGTGDGRPAVPRALARGRGGGGITAERLLDGYASAGPGGVTLVHALRADEDEPACGCAGHSSARSLLAAALHEAFDVVVLDLEAGLGHVGRAEGTLAAVDALLVVVDPSRKSQMTAARTVERAASAGIAPVALVGNRAAEGDDEVFGQAATELGVPLAGVVPFSAQLADADRAGRGIEPVPDDVHTAVGAVVAWLLPPP
jgi:CO dehydrogenase maturation factor